MRISMRDSRFALAFFLVATLIFTLLNLRTNLDAQFVARDPGPRGAPVGAGGPVQGLTPTQRSFFEDGMSRFLEVDSVSGTVLGENGKGLGPGFNSNQCAGCHSQPATGGSSPSRQAFPFIGPNPQVAVANLDGATNIIPFFVTEDGPVREARFKYFLSAPSIVSQQRDGGVHNLFTIQGRVDATNVIGTMTGHLQTCQLAQPDFRQMAELDNLSLRIPTPVFGAGLIENIPEATIEANMQSDAASKRALGISGHPNRNPNDGTISRFGWKAQNKSLQLFAAEAYSVEIGVSNEVFPDERGYAPTPPPPNCLFNPTPEDITNMDPAHDGPAIPSDVVQFSTFMRYLDQPIPVCEGSGCSLSVQNGRNLFSTVGCALCHTPGMRTTVSYFGRALSNTEAKLYSDLLVHHMGAGLADDIVQGNAGPDEFRTAPLWGLGQRVFFLHDGRTQDLVQAIEQHASSGSEARGVVSRYNHLSENQKQDLLNFLRSL